VFCIAIASSYQNHRPHAKENKMNEQDLSIFDALMIAKEAELKSAAFYTDAVKKTTNPWGRNLFQMLIEFENHHYRKLSTLEDSLREKGAYIRYEAKKVVVSAPSSGLDTREENPKSVLAIINMALEIEVDAKKRYITLTNQTTDPDGKAMFETLAEEESKHWTLLNNVFWSVNNQGLWSLPK
jgi:rubrerythrin